MRIVKLVTYWVIDLFCCVYALADIFFRGLVWTYIADQLRR